MVNEPRKPITKKYLNMGSIVPMLNTNIKKVIRKEPTTLTKRVPQGKDVQRNFEKIREKR